MEPGELRKWRLNIMYYLLEKGPVLKHGGTIGMSAEQQIRIRHGASKFGQRGKSFVWNRNRPVFFEQAVTRAIRSRQFAGSPPRVAHPNPTARRHLGSVIPRPW